MFILIFPLFLILLHSYTAVSQCYRFRLMAGVGGFSF
nr:MAG TPA: hypothetical protein [Caudoviricetes sp.]